MSIGAHIEGGRGLDELIAILGQTGQGKMAEQAAEAMAFGIRQVQEIQFQSGVTPFGAPHRPRDPELTDPGVPLFRSGDLMRSALVKASGTEVVGSSGLIYSRVQHRGAVIEPTKAKTLRWFANGRAFFAMRVVIPARPFYPLPGEDLPIAWDNAGTAEVQRLVEDAIGGGSP